MLFLWCFSAPYWERFLAAAGAHCTIWATLCFWTFGISYSCEARVKCKIGYDGGLRKNSVMRRISCSSLSRVSSTRSSCSTSPTSPTSLSQDYEKYEVSSNNTYWEYEWTSTRRPVTNPVTGRRTSTGKPVTAWIALRKDVTGKNSHSLPERPKLRNAGGPELLGLYARDAQEKPYLEQQNLGELTTAEHKVLIETCESGVNHRYAIVVQNLAAQRSVTKQNFSRPTWNHFLEFGLNLRRWPWNDWKVYVDTVTVAIDHSTVDGFHDELQISAKKTKERGFDESVESKNFIWFVGMNITPFLFLTSWNSTNSGAQHYPNRSWNTSGTRGEKFGKELLWYQTLSRWTK